MTIASDYETKFKDHLVNVIAGGLDGYKLPIFSLNENTDVTVLAIKKDAAADGLEVKIHLPVDRERLEYNANRLNVHLYKAADGYFKVNKFRLG